MANLSGEPFHLARFIEAQDPVIGRVRAELRAGHKQSNWMWFIFPQLKGLGQSEMSQRFALSSMQEAQAYAAHPILGSRLKECTQLIIDCEGKAIEMILQHPDDRKFHSCVTLFSLVAPETPQFREAIRKFFGGEYDQRTLDEMSASEGL